MDQRAIHAKYLSPLWGFWEYVALGPTDESVGYCRMSLRDKRNAGIPAGGVQSRRYGLSRSFDPKHG